MRTNRIEEMTIVRNDNYRILEIQQKVFQPTDRFGIQIVGGLIQNENVRISEKCLCQ